MAHATGADRPEIWLTPIAPISVHDREPPAGNDFLGMFRSNAPWGNAAAYVKILKNATRFVQLSSDTTLSTVLQGLKARNIDYALETGLVPWTTDCGRGVEGFNVPGGATRLAEKVRNLGGTISNLSMDEPLFFAHGYSGRGACHYSIADIAKLVAAEVASLKQIFPSVKIGDIEPVGSAMPADWIEKIMQWVGAYRAATGEPLRFLHADVNWNGPWRDQLGALKVRLHAEGIPFGIIFIGKPTDTTGEAATRHAEERMVAVASDPSLAPDQVIIQSWMRYPDQNLPETQPGTMTYLVQRYLAAQTRLTAQRDGNRITGQLNDDDGRPVGGAQIKIASVDNGKGQLASIRTLSGTVPPDAASAVFGVRINKECDCSGTANVGIGILRYTDNGSAEAIDRTLTPTPQEGAGGRFGVSRGQSVSRNTLPFPVTPGSAYSVVVPMAVSHDSEGSGYVTIIFLDQQNKGIRRDQLPFDPTTQDLGEVLTNAAGRFSLPVAPELLQSGRGLDVRFSGDQRYRLSSTFVP